MTPVQVEVYAKQNYDDIISHEMQVTMHLPATDAVSMDGAITIQAPDRALVKV